MILESDNSYPWKQRPRNLCFMMKEMVLFVRILQITIRKDFKKVNYVVIIFSDTKQGTQCMYKIHMSFYFWADTGAH